MGRSFSFANLPIAQRLGIGFALAGVLAVIIALAVGFANTAHLRQATGSFDQALSASVSLGKIRSDLQTIHSDLSDWLLFGPGKDRTPATQELDTLSADLEQQLVIYQAALGGVSPQLATFEQDWQIYQAIAGTAAAALDANQLVQANNDLSDPTAYTTALTDISALEKLNQQQVDAAHATASQSDFAAVWGALAWALVGFFVVMFLAWFIVFSIIRQLEELLGLTRLVNQGNLSQRVHIQGRSEVAVVGASMNDMLDTISDLLVKEESLRTDLEQQIERFIAEVAPVGQGDLRLQAQVTDSQLGTLADVFNLIVEQLATLVARAQISATQTITAAASIVQQATALAQLAEQQAAQLGQANEGMGQLASAAVDVARLARTSAVTATESANSAQRGGQAAVQVLERVKRSTDQVKSIEEQMKTLSAHSKEIGAIVALIEEIAKQTQLVSLNATVQAGQAGNDFSRGFGVVADEIRRLGERTEEAVHQVTSLVRTVQGDIYSVTVSTGQTARDFSELAQLADEASRALQSIWTRVAQQAKDIQAITEVAVWQETVAGQAVMMIRNLAAMAKRMGDTALNQEVSARNLSEISQSLRASISAFRVPGAAPPEQLAGRQETSQLPAPTASNRWERF